jgi:beta-carotene hydroxylase
MRKSGSRKVVARTSHSRQPAEDGIPPIDRALFGPPRARERNPTVTVLALAVGVFALSSAADLAGLLPGLAASAVNCVCLYALYTVTHESLHRLAHRHHRTNDWMGRISAALEGMTLPGFRLVHLQHHAFPNDPAKDPDYTVAWRPRWLLPLWILVRLAQDNGFLVRHRLWRNRPRQLAEHLTTLGLQAAAVTAASLYGYFHEVLVLWLVPVVVSGALVEFSVAYLVHYPHASPHPMENTRLLRGTLLRLLTLNQSYHLIHHLWPSIRWTRYGDARDVVEHALAEHREAAAR